MNSKEHRKELRASLTKAADTLSQEIWGGQWQHVADLKTKPVRDCDEIIVELTRRCPGHSQEEYGDAISRAMFYNR